MAKDPQGKIIAEAADEAQDTADEPTILSTAELIDLIQEKIKQMRPRSYAAYTEEMDQVDRREFLKMLGIVGAGGLSLAMGAGIIRAEDHIQSITGYAQAKDSGTGKQTKQVTVPSGGTKNFSVSGGDTIQNMYIDISANGAMAQIEASGDGWTIGNIGFKGKVPRKFPLLVRGKNGTVGNIYLGDGSISGHKSPGLGPIACFIDHENTTGPIDFKNVHMSFFANNGIYGSPTDTSLNGQTMNIYNSYFDSNNISAFKSGGPQPCEVQNVTIRTDKPDQAPPASTGKNLRGIWALTGKTIVKDSDIQGSINTYSGAVVELQNTRWKGGGGNVQGSSAGSPNLDPPEGVPMSAEAAACMQ